MAKRNRYPIRRWTDIQRTFEELDLAIEETRSIVGFGAFQPADADLTAIAALAGTGIACRTAADTWALRTLLQPAAGITIANPGGVAGDPTFALADDLAGLEALAGTGLVARTAADTYVERTMAAPAAGFTIVNPGGVAGNPTFALADDLAALEAMAGTGIVVRTAANTYAQRSTVAPAAGLTITNPAGLAGDITFALANDLAALEGLGATGIACRSAADTWVQRTVTSTCGFTVTNPGGVAGNIDVGLTTDVVRLGRVGIGAAADAVASLVLNTVADLAGNFLTIAAGVVNYRTAAESLGDMGGADLVSLAGLNPVAGDVGKAIVVTGADTYGLALGVAPAAHNILSASHGDSAVAACVRGDIITGQGVAPLWTRLATGGANTVLCTDGTDPSWRTIVNADINAAAAIVWTKMANMNTSRLLGRGSAGAGAVEEMTLASTAGFDLTYGAGTLNIGATTDVVQLLRLGLGAAADGAASLVLTTVADAAADVDKFLVLDAGNRVDYRTGAETLSDIGASAVGHLHDGDTLQHDGVNSNGGAFSFTTTGAVTFSQDIIHAGNLYIDDIREATAAHGVQVRNILTANQLLNVYNKMVVSYGGATGSVISTLANITPAGAGDVTVYSYIGAALNTNIGGGWVYGNHYTVRAAGALTTTGRVMSFYSRPQAYSLTGSVGYLIGLTTDPYISSSTGAVTNVIGQHAAAGAYVASTSVITNWYQLLIDNPITGTNRYGVYINAIAGGGGVNYAIYSAGGASYHAGTFTLADDLIVGADNKGTLYGAGGDAKAYYNGTNLVIDPDLVGTGIVLIGATGDDSLQAAHIGVGVAPDATFLAYLYSGDSNGTASADADELVIESDGDAGLSVLVGDMGIGRVFFADNDDTGVIYWSEDTFRFYADGTAYQLLLDATKCWINPTGADYDTQISWDSGTSIFVQGSDGYVMVGAAVAPDSLLHVYGGSAGAVAAVAGTLLTIEDDASCYLQFLSPDANANGIYFGMATDNDRASIIADHNTSSMTITGHPASAIVALGSSALQLLWGATSLFAYVSATGEITINEDHANIDTRIEGDTDTHLAFFDAGADKACISTNAPLAAKLTILQDDASGESCLSLSQADVSEGFIDYVGTEQRYIGYDENSELSVMIEVNGTKYLMPAYAVTPP